MMVPLFCFPRFKKRSHTRRYVVRLLPPNVSLPVSVAAVRLTMPDLNWRQMPVFVNLGRLTHPKRPSQSIPFNFSRSPCLVLAHIILHGTQSGLRFVMMFL